MSRLTTFARRRALVTHTVRQPLNARWRCTLEVLEAAPVEYRALHAAAAIDMRALRKAAQRLRDPEQLARALPLG
jgi:hypothetical protein